MLGTDQPCGGEEVGREGPEGQAEWDSVSQVLGAPCMGCQAGTHRVSAGGPKGSSSKHRRESGPAGVGPMMWDGCSWAPGHLSSVGSWTQD